MRLGLLNSLFASGCPTKALYAFAISHIDATQVHEQDKSKVKIGAMLGAVTKLHAFQPSASGSDYFTLTGTPGTIFMMPSAAKKKQYGGCGEDKYHCAYWKSKTGHTVCNHFVH
jgi:hypothetical protein